MNDYVNLCPPQLVWSITGTPIMPEFYIIIFVVVVVCFILSRLLCLAFSANLGLLCMPHPGMGPLV